MKRFRTKKVENVPACVEHMYSNNIIEFRNVLYYPQYSELLYKNEGEIRNFYFLVVYSGRPRLKNIAELMRFPGLIIASRTPSGHPPQLFLSRSKNTSQILQFLCYGLGQCLHWISVSMVLFKAICLLER